MSLFYNYEEVIGLGNRVRVRVRVRVTSYIQYIYHTIHLSYNRILKHPTAIDITDPANKRVFDNTLKHYASSRWYLVNSTYLLELRHQVQIHMQTLQITML